MTPRDGLKFAVGFGENLTDGWGFLTVRDGETVGVVINETPPELPRGWMIWLAKQLQGGRILKGAVLFGPDDTPEEVERRAWLVLAALRRHELSDQARWN